MLTPVLLAFALATATAQSAPATATATGLIWEYPDADVKRVNFVVCLDALPCVTLAPGDVQAERAQDAPEFHSTFVYRLPPLLAGDHRIAIRACDASAPEICAADKAVAFRLVFAPPAVVDPRLRK